MPSNAEIREAAGRRTHWVMKVGRIMFSRAVLVALSLLGIAVMAIADVEAVGVVKVMRDTAIVVRSNGECHLIQTGVGCISLPLFEGKAVFINSPGIFLGIGSTLLIPEVSQQCQIWGSQHLGASCRLCEDTSIDGTVSGSIQKGHVFKTRSGHFYEVVEYVYLYEYAFSPDVLVLSRGSLYTLVIDGFDRPLACKRLDAPQVGTAPGPMPPQSRELTIKVAQTALSILGLDPGPADGTLNAQTRSAVRDFRTKAGIGFTSYLDASTLWSLGLALAEKRPDDSDALTLAVYLVQAAESW